MPDSEIVTRTLGCLAMMISLYCWAKSIIWLGQFVAAWIHRRMLGEKLEKAAFEVALRTLAYAGMFTTLVIWIGRTLWQD